MMHEEKKWWKIVGWSYITLIIIIILTYMCSCKVHKVITKDAHKSDSSFITNRFDNIKMKVDSAGTATKENEYKKITVELGGDVIYAPHGFKCDSITIPKGTKITYETGTQKETDQATKKVSAESSQKENSKVEVTKKEMHIEKHVDKTIPAKWEVILFCSVLIIGGVVWHFKKPILSRVKGWITGV